MSGIIKPTVGAQLKLDHPLARGLVGCWLINEGSGNKLFDVIHGTDHLFSGVYPPSWSGGNLAFTVENGDSYVDLANARGVRPLGDAFTIDLLTYMDNVSEADDTLFFWDASTSWRCGLCRLSTVGWPTRLVGGGTQDYMVPSGWPPATTGLYHIILVWDGTNKSFYLNGKLLQSKVALHGSGNIGLSDCNNIRLGRAGDYAASTQIVRHFRLYNRALSAQEIATLYAFPYAMFEEESPYWILKAAGGAVWIPKVIFIG